MFDEKLSQELATLKAGWVLLKRCFESDSDKFPLFATLTARSWEREMKSSLSSELIVSVTIMEMAGGGLGASAASATDCFEGWMIGDSRSMKGFPDSGKPSNLLSGSGLGKVRTNGNSWSSPRLRRFMSLNPSDFAGSETTFLFGSLST